MYSDEQFRIFINRLSKTMDMSNTIIIFSSDHGESFSHGYSGHIGNHLYESLVHVPLIIKIPWKTGGRVIDVPVELTDIPATILELSGITIPEWIEGRSLLSLIEGESLDTLPVFSMQLIKNSSFEHQIAYGTFAVWEDDYKLIHYLEENKSLLFNLKQDPDERINLFEKESEIGQRLLGLIRDNIKKAHERIADRRETDYKVSYLK